MRNQSLSIPIISHASGTNRTFLIFFEFREYLCLYAILTGINTTAWAGNKGIYNYRSVGTGAIPYKIPGYQGYCEAAVCWNEECTGRPEKVSGPITECIQAAGGGKVRFIQKPGRCRSKQRPGGGHYLTGYATSCRHPASTQNCREPDSFHIWKDRFQRGHRSGDRRWLAQLHIAEHARASSGTRHAGYILCL